MTSTDPSLPPPPSSAYREPPERAPVVLPFEARELRSLALRPHRAVDLVLVERARLARTLAHGENLGWLIGILLCVSVLSTLPYAAVLDPQRALRVAALSLGSVAICFPSLHVFSGYFGGRSGVAHNLGLALVVSAVAGVFTLSFAPIVGFIRLTTPAGSPVVGQVSAVLLAVSVVAGVLRLGRPAEEAVPGRSQRLLLVGWAGLLLFIAHRMGVFLELV